VRVTQIYGWIFGRIIPNLGWIIRPPENWLRTRRRRGARHSDPWPDIWPDYSRSGPEYPAAGLSGPNLPQIIRPLAATTDTFREGVFIPLPLIFSSLLVLIKNKTLFGANLIARSPPSTTQSLRSLEEVPIYISTKGIYVSPPFA
jgi:hypothetical protein